MEFTEVISLLALGTEAVGVLVMLVGAGYSSVVFMRHFNKVPEGVAYQIFRRQLGRSIILGLEFLIAGDIMQTIVVAATWENVAVLGLIILIRTFLSMILHLEIEGRWPWQQAANDSAGSARPDGR
ncbi:DUF1622 domain-containing protein [Haliea sp. E1-2-M8]|uniref:DUF1622 domain-containing protein n=1 Tax=Haliea sp. E1-2-M8 TaxID=3064706 RepID=UPI002717CCE7|nr:DUF1622 domain-containing protein [Haliea sp. E1-2-M8]MDO8860573.1 DUF1622 domain-containing protein [Haliea sp. E1-2-M8]